VHNKLKKSKNIKSLRCVILCDLIGRKNNILEILKTFWKGVHRKDLSCMKFYGFQARWASYGHKHDIVCSNDPILCTCVHLGMSNNIDLGCSNFRGIKSSFFIFLVPKMGLLWSIYHKYVSKIYHHNFQKYYNIYYAQLTSSLHGIFF
jgi:hypothetical protein